MTAALPQPGPDPARESWEQDLLSLALDLSQSRDDVVPFARDGGRINFVNSAAGAHHVLVEQRSRYMSVPLPLAAVSRALTEPGAALLRHKLRAAAPRASPPLSELVTTAVDALLDHLAATARDAAPVDLLPVSKSALLGLMTRALFGVSPPAAAIAAAAAAKEQMERYRAYSLPPGTIPAGTAAWHRLQNAFETERNYSHAILAEAGLHDLLLDSGRPVPRFDEESLGPSAAQPLAAVSRVLMNSYNGPAIALSWIAWILGRHPATQARVAAEAAAVFSAGATVFDEAAPLTYTRQVVQETLRLYPPAWLLARQTIEEDTLSGVHLARDATVVLSPFTLQRDPRYWAEPEAFRPERFDPRTANPPEPGAYLPFGLGASGCPASAFALKELQYAIARLVHRFELHAAPDDATRPWGLISLHPSPGAVVLLRGKAARTRRV